MSRREDELPVDDRTPAGVVVLGVVRVHGPDQRHPGAGPGAPAVHDAELKIEEDNHNFYHFPCSNSLPCRPPGKSRLESECHWHPPLPSSTSSAPLLLFPKR